MAELRAFKYAKERVTYPTVRIPSGHIRGQAVASAPVLFIGRFVFGLLSV